MSYADIRKASLRGATGYELAERTGPEPDRRCTLVPNYGPGAQWCCQMWPYYAVPNCPVWACCWATVLPSPYGNAP